jgi:hypothetical protein
MQQIPSVTFHYAELTKTQSMEKGDIYLHFTHRLIAIESNARSIEIPLNGIELNTLSGSDLAQIQIFNEVYIPESNTESIRLIFHELDGVSFTCKPTPRGTLCILPTDKESTIGASAVYPDQTGDGDVYFAASAYTIVHDYVETNSGRCFHVGLSFLPTGPIFFPLWMCSSRLGPILKEWRGPKLDAAKRESLLMVRGLSGKYSIRHVLSRVHEKNDPLLQ